MDSCHPSIWAGKTPDKPAYIMADNAVSVSYKELEHCSNQIAHLFRQLGLVPGDHIALLMENNEYFYKIIWGAQRAGLIYTPIHTHLALDEASYVLNNCQAKLFISTAHYSDLATQMIDVFSGVEHFYSIGSVDGYEEFISAYQELPVTAISDQVAGTHMMYSSGTTGRPKGILPDWVPARFDDLPELLKASGRMIGLSRDSVYLNPAPLYHAAPMVSHMVNMSFGGTSIIMERFDAQKPLAAIETYRVTHSQWVPIMFIRMLRLNKPLRCSFDLSSMQQATHSAAPCPKAIKYKMIEWWGPIISEYYASSEAIGFTYINSNEWLSHPGSVGKSMAGEIAIIDDNNELLPPGEVGSIYFSGAKKFEYYNEKEKTQEAMHKAFGATCGDVGYVDEEGYLYLTDRRNFTIISGGVNIYPQEIENLIMAYPGVSDVAVFGIPNEEFGEEIKAVIELDSWGQATQETARKIMGWCRDSISPVKVPKSISFEEKLPRQDNGKLYKQKLKEKYS